MIILSIAGGGTSHGGHPWSVSSPATGMKVIIVSQVAQLNYSDMSPQNLRI